MADGEDTGGRSLAEIKRAPIVVEDDTTFLFDTGKFEQLTRLASLMAACKTMPEHLRGSVSDCFRVASQAMRWGLDPFTVADKTYFTKGKIAYEGQLIAAVINARSGIEGRLRYEFEGDPKQPESLLVRVIGKFPDENFERMATVEWKAGYALAQGAKSLWLSQPQQQLSYFAARVWARRHCPEIILGAYTPEELYEPVVKDVTPLAAPKTGGSNLDRLEAIIRDRNKVSPAAVEDDNETDPATATEA